MNQRFLDFHQIHRTRRHAFLGLVRGKLERSNDEVDRTCLRLDVGIILAGYATRTPPAAGRDGHYCPRSMRSWYAHGERHLRENTRSPRRQQVRPRIDLLVGRFGWQYDAAKLV